MELLQGPTAGKETASPLRRAKINTRQIVIFAEVSHLLSDAMFDCDQTNPAVLSMLNSKKCFTEVAAFEVLC